MSKWDRGTILLRHGVARAFCRLKNGYHGFVPCQECERLLRHEIDLTRRASEAETRLEDFCPEPPFGEAVVNAFRACEQRAEESRTSLLRARGERVAHAGTHLLTLRS